MPPNPSELLASRQAQRLFKVLADRFEIVLIDSPPVLPVTDAAILAAYADATLMIVQAALQTAGSPRGRDSDSGGCRPLRAIVNRIPHQAAPSTTATTSYRTATGPAPVCLPPNQALGSTQTSGSRMGRTGIGTRQPQQWSCRLRSRRIVACQRKH